MHVVDGQAHAKMRRNHWYLRFYLWLYAADIERINFCKLFWGAVFCIPVLLIAIFVRPVAWAFSPIASRLAAWQARRRATKLASFDEYERVLRDGHPPVAERETDDRKARRRARYERFLARISTAADRFVGFCQSSWRYVRWVVFALAGALALGLGAATIYGIYWLASNSPMVYAYIAIVLVGCALLVVLMVGIALMVQSQPAQLVGGHVASGGRRVGDNTLGFFGMLKGGILAVKHRTCPVIELTDE